MAGITFSVIRPFPAYYSSRKGDSQDKTNIRMNINFRRLAPDASTSGSGESTMGNPGGNLGVVNGTSGTGMERDTFADADDTDADLSSTSDDTSTADMGLAMGNEDSGSAEPTNDAAATYTSNGLVDDDTTDRSAGGAGTVGSGSMSSNNGS